MKYGIVRPWACVAGPFISLMSLSSILPRMDTYTFRVQVPNLKIGWTFDTTLSTLLPFAVYANTLNSSPLTHIHMCTRSCSWSRLWLLRRVIVRKIKSGRFMEGGGSENKEKKVPWILIQPMTFFIYICDLLCEGFAVIGYQQRKC